MKSEVSSFNKNQKMSRDDFEIFYYMSKNINDIQEHRHDFYEVYVFLSGNVRYKVNDKEYDLRHGDILLMAPQDKHRPIFIDNNSVYERIVIWINKSYIKQISTRQSNLELCFDKEFIYHVNYLRPNAPDCKYIIHMLDQLINEYNDNKYGSDIYATSILGLMLAKFNRMSMQQVDNEFKSEKSGFLIAYVVDYINKHHSEKITLDDLEKYFFVSKYYLSDEFKRLLGITVGKYITQKRLESSKKMMDKGMTPSKIYMKCGFNDYATYYRAFKSEYKISPGEYLKSKKHNSKIPNVYSKI